MDARLGIVTGRRTAANRGQGVPVRLLQVMVTDLNDVRTVQLIEQAGEESNPPDGSLVVLLPSGIGGHAAVAVGDGVEPVLAIGGKRVYSVDPATHAVIAELRLDPDGRIAATGPVASLVLAPDGTVTAGNAAGSVTLTPEGVWQFHGIAAQFDCPVSAPAFAALTAGGGSGAITGVSVDVTGTVAADGDVTAGAISLGTHTHTGVQAGGSSTGGPQ
jgi:phage gp45-like